MKDRASAAAYDCFYFAVIGAIVLTPVMWALGAEPGTGGGTGWLILGAVILSAIYEIPATALWGQTIGKRLVGIRVAALDGTEPGWGRALRRWICFMPLGLVQEAAMLGLLLAGSSVAGDPQHRGLHDRFADTIVIRATDPAARFDPLRPRTRR